MRLNRYLAAAGQGSRRSCEELILSGVVTINGVTCTSLSTQVAPNDVVKVRNKVMQVARPVTLILHKPAGFLCTAADTHSRRTIFDLLPKNFPRVFHVGRLDMESEGLLIVTNDGDLSLQLTHPRYKVAKEYEVVLNQPFDFTLAAKMMRGISTPEGMARAVSVHRQASNKIKVVLRQGLKRQIRLMFYALGYEVTKLTRTRIGPVTLQGLPPATWRELTQREITALLASRAEEAPIEKPARPAKSTRAPYKPRTPKAPRPQGDDEEAPTWAGEWEGDWEKEWASFESGDAFEENDERPARSARPARPAGPTQPDRPSRAPRRDEREKPRFAPRSKGPQPHKRSDSDDRERKGARPSRPAGLSRPSRPARASEASGPSERPARGGGKKPSFRGESARPFSPRKGKAPARGPQQRGQSGRPGRSGR